MLWLLVGLMILILFVLLRAIIGPTVIDRLLSINAIQYQGQCNYLADGVH